MGKYDDILAGLPEQKTPGKYDDLVADLPSESNQSKLREAIGAVPGLMQKIGHLVPGMEPLSTVSEMYPASQEIKEGFPKAGGAIAENLGKRGWNPNVAAIPATAVAIAPEIASSVMGVGEIVAGDQALMQAIRNTPKDIGRTMRQGLSDAGVVRRPPELASKVQFEDPYVYPSNLTAPKYVKVENPLEILGPSGKPVLKVPSSDTVPIKSGNTPIPRKKPTIPAEYLPSSTPKKYPSDPATFHNFAEGRINKFGEKLNPQEITDYKTILSQTLTEMKAKGLSETPLFSDLSNLMKKVTETHNSVIPGRAELNKVYGLSKAIRSIPAKTSSAAKDVAKAGTGIAVLSAIGKYLGQ